MKTTSRWIVCFFTFAASAACANDCERICETTTDCRTYCDDEGPSCDEDREREADRESCVRECTSAADDRGERCEESISMYRGCVDRHACSERPCSGESLRYVDTCLNDTAGAATCRMVCEQLAYGCYPFELFGYPGPDCDAVCVDAARQPACSAALSELQECQIEHAHPVAPCLQIDSTCLPQAETFVERCDGFAPNTVDPEEEAFCAAAAITICLCNDVFYSDPACEPRTTDRCLYQLQVGEACRAGWEEHLLCLESLEPCTNASAHDNCETQAEARFAACQ